MHAMGICTIKILISYLHPDSFILQLIMDYRHYVITTRPVDLVQSDNVQDQYWYRSDENSSAENALPYFRCGQYADMNGVVAAPSFFNPDGEDSDYPANPAPPDPATLQPRGGSLQMLTSLFEELDSQKKDLLLFMFGYNNGLVKEYDHIANIQTNYINNPACNFGRLLMITWPSQCFGEYTEKLGNPGLITNLIDKISGKNPMGKSQEQISSDVGITGNALSVFLLKMNNFIKARYASGNAPKIHFIVQSMANHILDQTFNTLQTFNSTEQVHGLMDNLMLTSPDIRNDIFTLNSGYSNATGLARKAFVVYSPQDPILKLADTVHPINGASRLGLTGPSTGTLLPSNTNTIEVNQTNFKVIPADFNHRYFEYNAAVISRYAAIFQGKEDATPVNA